ncbi:MAG: hypothetical protein ACRYGF_04360 [Janthinobacterium lividum]
MPEPNALSPEEFSRHLALLETLARSVSSEAEFLRVTKRAKEAGMTYKEALEAVIRESAGGAD